MSPMLRSRSEIDRTDRAQLLEHPATPVGPVVRDQPFTQQIEWLVRLEFREDPDRLVSLDVHRGRLADHLRSALVASLCHAASRVPGSLA
jgi:hypothetical protein